MEAKAIIERYGSGDTDFAGVRLKGAMLASDFLGLANLQGANPYRANLGGARLGGANSRGGPT